MAKAFDAVEKSADARAALLLGASDVDRQVLSSLYRDLGLVGLVFAGLASTSLYRWTRRPFLSAVSGAVWSTVGITIYAARRGPSAAHELVCQPGSSTVTDDIICPVVDEFSPCEQNPLCRRILTGTSDGRGETLLECVRLCRARVCAAHVHVHVHVQLHVT